MLKANHSSFLSYALLGFSPSLSVCVCTPGVCVCISPHMESSLNDVHDLHCSRTILFLNRTWEAFSLPSHTVYGETNACLQGLKRTVCNEASAAGDSESVCVCAWLCASIKCCSQRCPEFLLHQSDAYSENARRRSLSRAGGTEQLGDGCQPGPWHHLCSETTQACSHTPASYLPLELFTPGSVCFSPTTTSQHLFGSNLLYHNTPTPVN